MKKEYMIPEAMRCDFSACDTFAEDYLSGKAMIDAFDMEAAGHDSEEAW